MAIKRAGVSALSAPRKKQESATRTESADDYEVMPRVKRKTVRVNLPSGRIAEFNVPNVAESMRMQDKVAEKAFNESEEITARRLQLKSILKTPEIAVRLLLVGVSREAVAPIFKPDLSRNEAEKIVKAAYTANALKQAQFEDVAPAEAERDCLARIDAGLEPSFEFDVESAMMDFEKMCSTARLDPVTDLQWEEQSGYVGEMLNSSAGEEAFDDYHAMLSFVPRLLKGVPTTDPKAQKRRPVRFFANT